MEPNRTVRLLPTWFWIASVWTGLGLFEATQTVVVMRAEGMHHAWTRLFFALLLSWLPWALATPWVLHLARTHPPKRFLPISNWTIHIFACLAIGALSTCWTAFLEVSLNPWAKYPGPGSFLEIWPARFFSGLLGFILLYGSILALYFLLDSRERLANQRAETARLNEQLSKAELTALRCQIEPHFLFNTLNAISGLVREGRGDDAVTMVAHLSEFLRRVMEDSNRQEVPLAEEMEFLSKYLKIQKARFAERLHVSLDVPHDLLAVPVPSLILQPLVENAVKHGIARRAHGGNIRVSASRNNGMLKLTVYNDGPKLPEDWDGTRSGIGMSNLRTRMQGLYGERFELHMRNQKPDGVEVSVSLPFRDE